MAAILYYAIPFFVLLLIVEAVSYRSLGEDSDLVGYEIRDTRASLAMGLGNVAINVAWKFVVLAAYVGLYELTPLRLSPHTERIGRMPCLFEAIFNTPSHHRVHHGSNEVYLDKNYGGILIVWDRLFGTFSPEAERARYGLTKNIHTFHPVQVAFHEYRDLLHDLRHTDSWSTRLSLTLRGPGWRPKDQPDLSPPTRG